MSVIQSPKVDPDQVYLFLGDENLVKERGGNLADLITPDLSCSGECAKRSPGHPPTLQPTNLCQPRLSHQPSLAPALGGDDDIRICGFESGQRFFGPVVITKSALATYPFQAAGLAAPDDDR